MFTLRRSSILLTLFALLTLSPSITAEDKPESVAPDSAHLQTLPIDLRAGLRLQAARKYIEARDWPKAVELLQLLLDDEYESMVRSTVSRPDGWIYVNVRLEALRLLTTLPGDGRQYYQAAHGRAATDLLVEARQNHDAALLARVARRYPLTCAGVEALQEIAGRYTDSGEPMLAAMYYDQLAQSERHRQWSSGTLIQAAYAYRGDGRPSAVVEKELFDRAGDSGLRLADRILTVEQLTATFEKAGDRRPVEVWPMFGGDATRTAVANDGIPDLTRIVGSSLVEDSRHLRDRVDAAVKQLETRNRPMIPGSFPITAFITRPGAGNGNTSPVACYRTYNGVACYNLRNLRLHWRTQLDWSIEKQFKTTAHFSAVSSWVDWYVNQANQPSILFENSTIGTLSTDGVLLFAVDDLAVPPPPHMLVDIDKKGPRGYNPDLKYINAELKRGILASRLRAYSLLSGKLIWEQGNGKDEAPKGDKELRDSDFLGPPLPLGNRLYCLTQRNQEFRLVTLDPRTGRVRAVQTLAVAPTKLMYDPLRRIEAAHLACSEGVLVCPTNAGFVIGVDLTTGSTRWAYAYRDQTIRFLGFCVPPLGSTWKSTAPFVRDGKVVFTAPDADGVHCLNLNDGTPLWTHKRREDDAYCAGIDGGKVLIVGRKSVRALSLDSGKTLWKLDTGMPSGRGTFGKESRYYLPLASNTDGKPAIAVLNVTKGVVASMIRAPKDEVPGNLLFFDGKLLSQSVTEFVVYPLK